MNGAQMETAARSLEDMQPVNYIALAVPLFFILIGLELAIARRRGARVYRVNDAVNAISCGVTQQIVMLFSTAALLACYAAVYDRARVVTWEHAAWPWLISFVGVDFLYYWWHRASHEVNLLWAAHVVHHQSEEYNLAVALRQGVATSWTALPFYLPLAVVGVPPVVWAAQLSFSTLYQFWIHTRLVGRLPLALEWALNTPSHHRVHHAVNPQYLDKNHGAIFIVWDRLFGTYAEEVEAPRYGLTKPLASFNPLWAQVHYWVELARLAWRAPTWGDRLAVWVRGPAWRPAWMEEIGVDKNSAQESPYDPPLAPSTARRVVVAFGATIAAAFALMLFAPRLPTAALAGAAAAVLVALQLVGVVLDRGARDRRWRVARDAL
jgi:sterol desaturase/sphingolipid hydroxylase (fatty acid hydroxylase superfamily)